jgi:CheY-like chemotaxis protein
MADPTPLILLLDDDVDFLEIHRQILEHHGYRVVCAEQPDAAWKLLEGQRPDLIVSDLMMHALDAGFSFAKRVKTHESYKTIPIVIATAVGSAAGLDFRPRSPKDLAAMGADAFLCKPIKAEELIRTIAKLLGQ